MNDIPDAIVDEVLTLRRTIGWSQPPREVLEAALSKSLATVSRRHEDGTLIGYCRAVGDGALYVVLVDVMVRPDHQRRGLGAAMVTELLSTVSPHAPIILIADPGVQSFYENLGFTAQRDRVMQLA
jgi:GNAT superfamily N-acetyltransferase